MKTISEFELEEYRKMLSELDLSDVDEDKSKFFNSWNFGNEDGEYIVTNSLSFSCNESEK